MIKKTKAKKAKEIIDGIEEDGFDKNDAIGILFVAIRGMISDEPGSIDHIKRILCKFFDDTSGIKRKDFL
jgi:hypothetical protein